MVEEEVVLHFPGGSRDKVAPVTEVKGTWIATSLRSFREHGLYDRYVTFLPDAYREAIVHSVTTEWHPIEVLLAHYDACERFGLSDSVATAMGREATARVQGGTLGVTARLVSTNTGVTPWTILPQYQRFWSRFFRGGGLQVLKLGPKEARIDLVGFPGLHYPYCRAGCRGVVETSLALFCRKVYVTELTSPAPDTELVLRASWV